jgi:exodeoxyribonuclease VII large subunit
VPFAPQTIGLITSRESAACADFIKILNERWCGVKVVHYDVQVQGDQAVVDIVQALQAMNQTANSPEVVIITRGGGSADDLATFGHEHVVRAIAASRIPTLVAIGHEVDVSLAELAADLRASTPSNAAQLLTPDKRQVLQELQTVKNSLAPSMKNHLNQVLQKLEHSQISMLHLLQQAYTVAEQTVNRQADLLQALSPQAAMRRGYAVLQANKKIITSAAQLKPGNDITILMHDGNAQATVK